MKATDPDTRQDGPVTGTDAPWHQADLVALDLEGSGAQDRENEAILEIALVVPLTAGKPAVAEAYATLKNGGVLFLQPQVNKAHNSLRAIGERGNSPLKTTFKALRNVSLDPWRIGKIVAAALIILHIEHDRTT